jgi:hypothetical protein
MRHCEKKRKIGSNKRTYMLCRWLEPQTPQPALHRKRGGASIGGAAMQDGGLLWVPLRDDGQAGFSSGGQDPGRLYPLLQEVSEDKQMSVFQGLCCVVLYAELIAGSKRIRGPNLRDKQRSEFCDMSSSCMSVCILLSCVHLLSGSCSLAQNHPGCSSRHERDCGRTRHLLQGCRNLALARFAACIFGPAMLQDNCHGLVHVSKPKLVIHSVIFVISVIPPCATSHLLVTLNSYIISQLKSSPDRLLQSLLELYVPRTVHDYTVMSRCLYEILRCRCIALLLWRIKNSDTFNYIYA